MALMVNLGGVHVCVYERERQIEREGEGRKSERDRLRFVVCHGSEGKRGGDEGTLKAVPCRKTKGLQRKMLNFKNQEYFSQSVCSLTFRCFSDKE